MNDSILLTEQYDGVAVIILNRPEVMNSFNFALLHALAAKMADIRFDPDVRVIIITGNGPSFCAGLDLGAIGKEDLFDPRGDGSEGGSGEIRRPCRCGR